jgi:aspartate/glutamate racemase
MAGDENGKWAALSVMIVEQADSPVPLLDTTAVHSKAAFERALA